MGFFSWRCAKTDLPILAGEKTWPEDLHHLTKVVLVLPSETRVHGTYGGFGRMFVDRIVGNEAEGMAAADAMGDLNEVRLVSEHAYAGERYDDLQDSRIDPGQGFFHDPDAVRDLMLGLQPLPEMDDDEFEAAANRVMGGRLLGSSVERESLMTAIRDGIREAAAAGDGATVEDLRRRRNALAEIPVSQPTAKPALEFGFGDTVRVDLGDGLYAKVSGPREKTGAYSAMVTVSVDGQDVAYTNFMGGIPKKSVAGKGLVDVEATDGHAVLKSGKLIFLFSAKDGVVGMDVWFNGSHQSGKSHVWPAAKPEATPEEEDTAGFRP